jgi:DNA polymerase
MMTAGQNNVLHKIRASDADKSIPDVYCSFASTIYGRTITKADTQERDLGKTGMLSLQFGTGADKFMNMARIRTGQKISHDMSQQIVYAYRNTHPHITAMWNKGDNVILPAMYNQDGLIAFDVNGWCLTHLNGIALPGCPGIRYHNLHKDMEGNWAYTMGRQVTKTYGANVFQNMVQHLARQIVMWQTDLVNTRYQVVLSVYDEIVCVVPDEEVAACKKFMLECLQKTPPWCVGLPLAGSVSHGQTYGEAK